MSYRFSTDVSYSESAVLINMWKTFALALMVILHGVAAIRSPSSCECVNATLDCSFREKTTLNADDKCDTNVVRIDLSKNRFTNIPENIDPNITEIILQGNQLTRLPRPPQLNLKTTVFSVTHNKIHGETYELKELSALKELYISFNIIRMLNFLPDPCGLRIIDAEYNNINDISHLQKCHDLEWLSLKGNLLSNITSGALVGLTKLLHLSLGSVHIRTLPDGIFDYLTDLLVLDLSGNFLSELTAKQFAPLKNLQTLNIESNPLTSVPKDTLAELGSLKELDLSKTRIQVLGSAPFAQNPQLIKLKLGSLRFLKSVAADTFCGINNLELLDLNHNSLNYLPPGLLNNLTKLLGLSLEHCALNSFPIEQLHNMKNLNILDISDNNITTLPPKPFSSFSNLTLLKISRNPFDTLENDTFYGLPNLLIFYAEMNSMQSLPGGIFLEFKSLKKLGLMGNRLSSLRPVGEDGSNGDFNALCNVTFLDLSLNQLTELPAGTFDQMMALGTLLLSGNKLTSLPSGIFHKTSSLHTLSLSHNQLTVLPEDVFANLKSLRTVLVAANALTSLPNQLFDNSRNVSMVLMGNNKLSTVGESTFRNLSSLFILDMSFNQLSALPKRVFTGLTNMRMLSLRNNYLSTLPATLFQDMPVLYVLQVAHNRLTTLLDYDVDACPHLISANFAFNNITEVHEDTLRSWLGPGLLPRMLNLRGNMLSEPGSLHWAVHDPSLVCSYDLVSCACGVLQSSFAKVHLCVDMPCATGRDFSTPLNWMDAARKNWKPPSHLSRAV